MAVSINETVLTQFEHYLSQISLSPKTIASYMADLRGFTRWATEVDSGNFLITAVTPNQIRAYLTYLLEDLGRAPTTVNRHLQALRKCCAFITEVKLAAYNPADEISSIRAEMQATPSSLSSIEVKALIKGAYGTWTAIAYRDQAIVRLLVEAGLRVSELIDLRIDDVIFEYPGVHLRVRDGRGNGIRRIPLPAELCRAIKDYLVVRPKTTAATHLFLTQEHQSLSARTVQRIVSRCAKTAQLAGVNAQLLRRTYAINLLNESGDLALVAERLGHQDSDITCRYLGMEGASTEANDGFK
jgi:site-specific recombinase XerD